MSKSLLDDEQFLQDEDEDEDFDAEAEEQDDDDEEEEEEQKDKKASKKRKKSAFIDESAEEVTATTSQFDNRWFQTACVSTLSVYCSVAVSGTSVSGSVAMVGLTPPTQH